MWLPWRRTNGETDSRLEQDKVTRAEIEVRLAETKDQWTEVHQVADELRRHRQANRFSERIMNAIRSGET